MKGSLSLSLSWQGMPSEMCVYGGGDRNVGGGGATLVYIRLKKKQHSQAQKLRLKLL